MSRTLPERSEPPNDDTPWDMMESFVEVQQMRNLIFYFDQMYHKGVDTEPSQKE